MGTMLAIVGIVATLFVLALLIDQAKREELFDRALNDEYYPLDTNVDEYKEDEGMDPRLLDDNKQKVKS